MGPQEPNDVARGTARDLSGLAGELAALKADARHCLTDPEYAVLHLRLENAHAAVEAALVEARRRVRMKRSGRQKTRRRISREVRRYQVATACNDSSSRMRPACYPWVTKSRSAPVQVPKPLPYRPSLLP
jgi:hypothetical protein